MCSEGSAERTHARVYLLNPHLGLDDGPRAVTADEVSAARVLTVVADAALVRVTQVRVARDHVRRDRPIVRATVCGAVVVGSVVGIGATGVRPGARCRLKHDRVCLEEAGCVVAAVPNRRTRRIGVPADARVCTVHSVCITVFNTCEEDALPVTGESVARRVKRR